MLRQAWFGTGLLLLMAACAALGCRRAFCTAAGRVSSRGGELGSWSSKPDGCSRDLFDGLPPGQTHDAASFVWEDPSVHDPLRDRHRPTAPDAPLRLDVWRGADGLRARIATVKTPGTLLDPAHCGRLELESSEQPAVFAGGRPALAGTLRLECSVHGSEVSADLRFERCEF